MSKGNFLMNTVSGKLGNMVLYRAKGEQRARTYIKSVANPKTRSQMNQRTQLANLVSFYRVTKTLLDKAFQDKKPRQSDYNAFVSANLNAISVYLPREIAKNQGCVVAPYRVSGGSLPAIVTSGIGINTVTNIKVDNDFSITDDTTIGELSKTVVANNPSLTVGMQLSYVSIVQATDPQTGYPYCYANLFEITFDTSSSVKLRSIMPQYALSIVDGFIGHGTYVADGGFCWIISKKDATGKLLVSPQTLIVTSTDLYASFSSTIAQDSATRSYNSQADAFLTPGGLTRSAIEGIPAVSSVTAKGEVLNTGEWGEMSLEVNDTFAINGASLDPAKVYIWTSEERADVSAEVMMQTATVVTSRLADLVSIPTRISGKWNTTTNQVRQVCILFDGALLFRSKSAEGEDPTV